MKRVYKSVSVMESADKEAETGFVVTLDGRPVRTPGKSPLTLRSRAVAEEIAREWDAQDDAIVPDTMPFTQLASTALDRVAPRRGEIVNEIAAYGGSDLLCYRAQEPEDLAALQNKLWQPHLDWAATDLGLSLSVTSGIVHVKQSDGDLSTLRVIVDRDFSDFGLAALHTMVSVLGSLVLALAVSRGRLTARQAFDISRVDECFQIEKWGEDLEAKERSDRLWRDFEVAQRFLESVAQKT